MMSLLNQCSVLSKDPLIAPLCLVAVSAISTSWITQTLLCLQHTCPWHWDTFQYGWMDSSIYSALHIETGTCICFFFLAYAREILIVISVIE